MWLDWLHGQGIFTSVLKHLRGGVPPRIPAANYGQLKHELVHASPDSDSDVTKTLSLLTDRGAYLRRYDHCFEANGLLSERISAASISLY